MVTQVSVAKNTKKTEVRGSVNGEIRIQIVMDDHSNYRLDDLGRILEKNVRTGCFGFAEFTDEFNRLIPTLGRSIDQENADLYVGIIKEIPEEFEKGMM
ncbi:hypothetical protein Bhyg_17953 [Pseudolycoriella hygida]|uniref:Uncharacterized protein n=1 Tax=Pseudolycoriella hygida TaxID=35572 RepID=A0A9Q0MKL1_9DIPT|nr:hypothetical protein Bhyg_17953 [Pseudolycoriella hygida]